MSEDIEPERKARLYAVNNAMDLALGPEWYWVAVIGKPGPGGKDSVNMVGNCPPQIADKFLEVIAARVAEGITPREFPVNPS